MSKRSNNNDKSHLISNNEQLAKVKDRIDKNPMDPYSQHEIKSTGIPEETKCLMSEDIKDSKDNNQYKDNEQLAKVKGRVDEDPTNLYLQHEIKSTGIPEETQSLTGENSETSNLSVMEL